MERLLTDLIKSGRTEYESLLAHHIKQRRLWGLSAPEYDEAMKFMARAAKRLLRGEKEGWFSIPFKEHSIPAKWDESGLILDVPDELTEEVQRYNISIAPDGYISIKEKE